MGLRRVEARTGDPVSVRGAAIHNVVETDVRRVEPVGTAPIQ